MKKSIIPVAAFIAGMAIVPSVFAAKAEPYDVSGKLQSVKNFTSVDTIHGYKSGNGIADIKLNVSEANNKQNIVVKFDAMDLKYVKADEDKGHDVDAAWLGLQVTAPGTVENWKDAKDLDADDVTIYLDGEALDGDSWAFDSKTDGTEVPFINIYSSVTTDLLTKKATAGISEFTLATWAFDWNGDEGIDQTIEMVIDTTKINLFELDEDDNEKVLPSFSTEKAAELIAAAPEAPAEGDDTANGETNPNTADTIATYMTIAAVALLGLGATAFVAKKSNR